MKLPAKPRISGKFLGIRGENPREFVQKTGYNKGFNKMDDQKRYHIRTIVQHIELETGEVLYKSVTDHAVRKEAIDFLIEFEEARRLREA